MIKIGDKLPATQVTILSEDGPKGVALNEALGTGRVVLFGVPGAFTPTCSANHLPGFVEHRDALRAAGVDQVACMAVNDIFVMGAWEKASSSAAQVQMMADGNADATRAMGLELDASGFGMGTRCQRFSLLAEDGVVVAVFVDSGGEFRVSSAEHMLEHLSGQS